jgi:hypothetical protein
MRIFKSPRRAGFFIAYTMEYRWREYAKFGGLFSSLPGSLRQVKGKAQRKKSLPQGFGFPASRSARRVRPQAFSGTARTIGTKLALIQTPACIDGCNKKRKAGRLLAATGGSRFCLRPEDHSTKELAMATMNPSINERRHIPDRRVSSGAVRHGATRMNALDWVTMVLMIIGGLNWGLVGLFNFDLVATLFGQMSALSRIIYVLVGLSALYSIYTASKMGRNSR